MAVRHFRSYHPKKPNTKPLNLSSSKAISLDKTRYLSRGFTQEAEKRTEKEGEKDEGGCNTSFQYLLYKAQTDFRKSATHTFC